MPWLSQWLWYWLWECIRTTSRIRPYGGKQGVRTLGQGSPPFFKGRSGEGLMEFQTIVSIKPLLAVLVSGISVALIMASEYPNLKRAEFAATLVREVRAGHILLPVILSGAVIVPRYFSSSGGRLKFRVGPLGHIFRHDGLLPLDYSYGLRRLHEVP